MNAKPMDSGPKALACLLEDALVLLGADSGRLVAVDAVEPGALLGECLELCRQGAASPAPIRTLHHLSCTGGTLIAKCLAAMPNVVVFNEVDPLSTMRLSPAKPLFAPTDLIVLARQGCPGLPDALLVKLFLQGLDLLHQEFTAMGKRLLLRDHSHSHFLKGGQIPQRPSLLAMVGSRFPTLSVVSVRDPVDSYLSLQSNKWMSFSPDSFDEYCRRSLVFLDAHAGVPIFRYEDFVQNPSPVMKDICQALALSYSDTFADTFDAFRFSGDSGRKGVVIKPRPRRPVGEGLREEAERSAHYKTLIGRLGYASLGGDS